METWVKNGQTHQKCLHYLKWMSNWNLSSNQLLLQGSISWTTESLASYTLWGLVVPSHSFQKSCQDMERPNHLCAKTKFLTLLFPVMKNTRSPTMESLDLVLPGKSGGLELCPYGRWTRGRDALTCQYRYCTVSIYTSQLESLSNRVRWKLLLLLPYLCSQNLQFDSLHALTQVQSIKLFLGVKNTK